MRRWIFYKNGRENNLSLGEETDLILGFFSQGRPVPAVLDTEKFIKQEKC